MVYFLLLILLIVVLVTTLTDSDSKPSSISKNSQSFLNHTHSLVPTPTPTSTPTSASVPSSSSLSSNCFPSVGFQSPSTVPDGTDDWWCDPTTEYAFVGFSYEVTACQSLSQLQKDFADMRNTFHSRYVRIYGACDNNGFFDDVITAAWDNTLGVHALVWFGFDGSNKWMARRDSLFGTLHSNPKAVFVTRGVQFGSEPLFDGVLSPSQLTQQVLAAKSNLSSLGIPVTVSELAYGYQERGGAPNVLAAVDYINIHILPFFAQNATTGDQAWPNVLNDLDWFTRFGNGKKMYFDENGWPSVTSSSVKPNGPNAVASISSEHAYFNLLDQHCGDLKNVVGGGVGWFAHIYSDSQEPGYGIYNTAGKIKFPFAPRISC
ncbi:glycoside hydrolase superfamily [Lactifluus volemus]|nr:glycoside hydrolase superfamily [Lactifluus volemus]